MLLLCFWEVAWQNNKNRVCFFLVNQEVVLPLIRTNFRAIKKWFRTHYISFFSIKSVAFFTCMKFYISLFRIFLALFRTHFNFSKRQISHKMYCFQSKKRFEFVTNLVFFRLKSAAISLKSKSSILALLASISRIAILAPVSYTHLTLPTNREV